MFTESQIKKLESGKLNTGLIFEEPLKSDWMLGGGIPYEVVLKDGNWLPYVSQGEKQKFRFFDSMACVTYATLNSVEMQVNRMIKEGIIDTELIKDWIDNNGQFNLADRFLAKMSGTTRNGNVLNAPSEALRKFGCPPEHIWPVGENFSWAEYFRTPSKEAIEKGRELLEYFDFSYEWCSKNYIWGEGLKGFQVVQRELFKQLKQCPIIVGTAVCPGWFNGVGVIQACSLKPNHSSVFINGEENKIWDDADSYPPFFKKLSWWYKVPFAVKLVVKPKANILKKNTMAKVLKQEGGDGYGLLLECRNPATLMGLAEAVGKKIPGEFPNDVNWEDLNNKLDGSYKLKE